MGHECHLAFGSGQSCAAQEGQLLNDITWNPQALPVVQVAVRDAHHHEY
jgi:hypothetical protein